MYAFYIEINYFFGRIINTFVVNTPAFLLNKAFIAVRDRMFLGMQNFNFAQT